MVESLAPLYFATHFLNNHSKGRTVRPMPVKRRRRRPHSPRFIPKTPHLRASLSRKDVTRAEYNHIIDILNDRKKILDAFGDAITDLRHALNIQFTRIAQIQADLDEIKRASTKLKLLA
jgi:hypothetical protein